jgi:hypothetical protein
MQAPADQVRTQAAYATPAAQAAQAAEAALDVKNKEIKELRQLIKSNQINLYFPHLTNYLTVNHVQ